MAKQKPTHYVVYWCEHLRDGIEEGAKVVSSIEEGLKLIDKIANGFAGCNCEFKMFELGKEVPIKAGAVEEPQPSKKTIKYGVK